MFYQRKQMPLAIGLLVFSLLVPAIGYFYVGALVASLFLVGYLGGFALWLLVPTKVSWSSVRVPYWTAFAIYLFLHKPEENRMKFFEVLGDKITGVPVPEVTPMLILGLLVLPLGAWLLIPVLIKREHPVGYYLAWTYFTSLGVVELAHFVFPFLSGDAFGYFPGMASASILAPAGIWGMWRLSRSRFTNN